jgi:hypothetical protein
LIESPHAPRKMHTLNKEWSGLSLANHLNVHITIWPWFSCLHYYMSTDWAHMAYNCQSPLPLDAIDS